MSSENTTSLLTDRYELTMLDAAIKSGIIGRKAIFEVFARSLPLGRRFGILCGTGRLVKLLERFRFVDVDLEAIEGIVSQQTIEHLKGWRFSGTVRAYSEGECYFADSPVLTVEATYGDAQLVETIVLSVLNHDSAIASAAIRMSLAAGNRRLIEMGSRRTHEYAAVAAARAAYIGGFHATANLEAGRRYGIPTAGTSAHSFTLAFPTEREAFEAQLEATSGPITALVDTYDMEDAIRTAAGIAGDRLGAIRIDSGDLAKQSRLARLILDGLHLHNTQIICTGDLDEYKIEELSDAPVDTLGIGTALVTGSGHPTANFIYKLVAVEDPNGQMIPVAKLSPGGKATVGGRKHPARIYDARGTAIGEYIGTSPLDTTRAGLSRPLQSELMVHGEVVLQDDIDQARARCQQSVEEFGSVARDISPGQAAITVQRLPKRALLVIDVQNDFCEGGSLAVEGGHGVAQRLAGILGQGHRTTTGVYDYVIATRDYHENPEGHFAANPDYRDTWPPHCVIGTSGAELESALSGILFDAIFDKGRFLPAYSGFEGAEVITGMPLEQWLADHEIGAVDVAGIATDYCVRATVLDARKAGIGVRVLADLCVGVNPETSEQAMHEMSDAGAVIA
ncbi:MAG: nicotinate phosphoribosyltransferase [Actinobacteria bacterium]|nr:nicotinate phosphoribosyltransferase [Actinomycetota bacterium]MCL5447515.1 nicotinate phosphoribosyltransferase [Actinomycetota bacterium]